MPSGSARVEIKVALEKLLSLLHKVWGILRATDKLAGLSSFLEHNGAKGTLHDSESSRRRKGKLPNVTENNLKSFWPLGHETSAGPSASASALVGEIS